MAVAKQSPPRADARPALVFRTLALLWVVFCGLALATSAFDLGDEWAMTAGIGIALTMGAIVATPGIALGVLAIMRPAHIGRDVRDEGRVSAVLFLVAGATMLVVSRRTGSTWALVGGLVLPTAGVWLLVRSWTLPPPPFEQSRRLSLYGVLFGLCVVAGLLYAAIYATDFNMGQDSRFRVAMKADLRNIVHAQREYRDSVGRFGSLRELRAAGWRGSSDVYVAMTADSGAFRGVATHAVLKEECTIWGGKRPGDARFTADEGEPLCRDPNAPVSR
jgi:hypothetical protein